MGNYPDAEEHLLHGYTMLNDDAGALPMYRVLARRYLAELYQRWGRPQDAHRYAAAKNQGGVVVPAAAVPSPN
jgi:hypothetical protein